jgi:hypothetical protein
MWAAEVVELMVVRPSWDAIHQVIQREIARIDRVLDSGPARDAAEYAKAHGRRGALVGAAEAAGAIISEAQRQRKQVEGRLEAAA